MAVDFNKKYSSGYDFDTNLDIFRILGIMRKKIVFVFLACLIAAGGMYALAVVNYKEEYTAKGSLLVNPKLIQYSGEEALVAASDLNLSTQLANTYRFLLTSDRVMDQVIADGNLGLTPAQIRKFINISQEEKTGIIKVEVTTTDPVLSQNIAKGLLVVLPQVVSETLDFGSIKVIDQPKLPSVPNKSSNTKIYPIIGLLLGFGIAFCITFFYDILSDTVKSVRDIQTKVGASLLSTIPNGEVRRKSRIKKKDPAKGLLIDSASASFAFVESYKSLRTKIENISMKKGYKKFIVTSAYQNEGKTTVALNMALALAQNGKTVVIVDCDLRRPMLDKSLGITADDGQGLAQYLQGEIDWKDTVKYISNHGIFVVLSGGVAENPSELLNTVKLEDFIQGLEREFDFVIIDTPPAKVVTDAVVISPKVDATILVVKQDYSDIESINSVIDDMSVSNAKVIGCVYNAVDLASSNKNGRFSAGRYFRKYNYRYGYGTEYYGYTIDKNKK